MAHVSLNAGQMTVPRCWNAGLFRLAPMKKNPTVLFRLAMVLKLGQLHSWAGCSSQLPVGLIIQLYLKVKTNRI